MWNSYWSSRPRRDLPRPNYNESSEEEYDSPLVSPQRPPVTRAGSPAELAIPTLNDNVDEELSIVAQTLENVGHTHTFRNTRPTVRQEPEGGEDTVGQAENTLAGVGEEVVNEGFITQDPGAELGADVQPAIMANYDATDGEDADRAMQDAIAQIRNLKFNTNDLEFFFNQAEIKMKSAGVKKTSQSLRF